MANQCPNYKIIDQMLHELTTWLNTLKASK